MKIERIRSCIFFLLTSFLVVCFGFSDYDVNALDAQADIVITHVDVVDVTNRTIAYDQEIVIQGDSITAIRSQGENREKARTHIDGSRFLAVPGFVNTHTHLWQHVAKGFYPSSILQDWIKIYRFAHYFTAQELHDVTLAAACQALLSGITTVSDFTSVNFSDFALRETIDAMMEAGLFGNVVWWRPAACIPSDIERSEINRMRDLYSPLGVDLWMGHGGFSFYPIPSVYDGILTAKALNMRMTEHTLENVQEKRDMFQNVYSYLADYGYRLSPQDYGYLVDLLDLGLPSDVDDIEYMRVLAQYLLQYPKILNKLTAEEQALLSDLSNPVSTTPIPFLDYLDALTNFVSIHSVWVNDLDMGLYEKNQVYVSHNPESNLFLSDGIAPVYEYQRRDILVTLGTDGAASNDGIDFFSAMRACWNLQKIMYLNPDLIGNFDAWETLRIATINGAKALGKDDRIGSLAVGKEADIVLMSKERLGLSPIVRNINVIPLLIYSAGVRDVDTVISDGRIVVAEGDLTTQSEADLAWRLTEISNAVYDRIESGKVWNEHYVIKNGDLIDYWYRYRSVRVKDQLSIFVTNSLSRPMKVQIVMTGTTFGGTIPALLAEEANERFPSENPAKYWHGEYTVNPGGSVSFEKQHDSVNYSIKTPTGTQSREGVNAEQLLILVTPLNKLPPHR